MGWRIITNHKQKRPRLDLPAGPLDQFLDLAALLAVLLQVAVLLWYWGDLPDQVAVHFGPGGQPDDWGSRYALWMLPGISIVMYGLFRFLKRKPHTFNYPWPITAGNAERQYRLARSLLGWVELVTVGIFTYLTLFTVQVGLGQASGLSPLFLPVTMAATFGPIIGYFILAGKSR